jgi:phosphatidylglycerophosphate synthase
MLSAADYVTFARIVLTLILYPLVLSGQKSLAIAVFILAALSDAVDGYLARRAKPTSHGKLLDSIADYFLLITLAIVIYLQASAELRITLLQPVAPFAILLLAAIAVHLYTKTYTTSHLPVAKFGMALGSLAGIYYLAGFQQSWPAWLVCGTGMLAMLEEMAQMVGINRRTKWF